MPVTETANGTALYKPSTSTLPAAATNLGDQHRMLFQNFAAFAFAEAGRLGLDTLYFCTREGVFFRAVHDRLFGDGQVGHPAVSSRLLETSRRATFGPSLVAGSRVELDRFWLLQQRISPRGFLASLNLDDSVFAAFFENCDMPLDQIVEAPLKCRDFQSVVRSERFAKAMHHSLNHQRQLATSYMAEQFGERQRVGLVEIGWQGSIQDNIAHLFPGREFHGFYLGLTQAKVPAPSNSFKMAFGPDLRFSSRYAALLNTADVLEFVTSSTGGSVERYEDRPQGGAIAVRSPNAQEDRLIQGFAKPFQEGVLAACAGTVGAALLASPADSLKESAMVAWQRLQQRPDEHLVEAYYGLSSNETFGMGGFRDQSRLPGWLMLIKAPFSSSDRAALRAFLKWSRWHCGFSYRKDVPPAKRYLLLLLMYLAGLARAIRRR